MNFKKEAMFICSFFFLVLKISFSQEVKIQHYQRNLELENIILPSESYNSKVFSILIPDSVYTAGSVRVKNLKVRGVKASGVLYFNHNSYSIVEYIIKRKNIDVFFYDNSLLEKQKEMNFKIGKVFLRGNKVKISVCQKLNN